MKKRITCSAAIILFVLAGFSFASRLYIDGSQPDGVIIADSVTVNSAPSEEFATEYTLFSGAEVRLLETQGNWVHLSGPNDVLDGWIPLDKVEVISGLSEREEPTF